MNEAATNVGVTNQAATNQELVRQAKVELTRDQAVILLTDGERGVTEWNEHCRVGHGTSNLQSAVLNGAYLRGANLARTDLTVALEVLAERLPGLRLLDDRAALPRRTVLRSPDALRVAWR